MKNYIGIDLGTTNSAICSYDGKTVRVWKSPEQNDVTPSAIYIDKRGNRYYGQRAYDQAPRYPENSARLFKRFMGTSEKIEIKGVGLSLTPEECSAEILKVLYGYLPEEIRNDSDTAVVITVPAAFNQMKKDATLDAAHMAGFDKVALMQEPVAAVMSVMQHSKIEGIFVIYDLGGGTFDVSIAENIGGKVNILSHGGIEACGGRDWDRIAFRNIILPWLKSNYNLPNDFSSNSKYKKLISMCEWAAEKAKIELSARDDVVITLNESEANTVDLNGEEIYVDIPLTRTELNKYITELVNDTVRATRETLKKAGLTANDVERIVFIGGPTNYKPLRDIVSEELAIPYDINVNPMTAVSEGAAIFAESIDWSSESHGRKKEKKEIKAENIDIGFRYIERSPSDSTRLVAVTNGVSGFSFEIISTDTGWTSGRAELVNGKAITLPLQNDGENRFEVKVYDSNGRPFSFDNNTIIITRTFATITAIPASHSIGIESLDSLGGNIGLKFLVNEGDNLPKKGTVTFKAGETIKAGSLNSLLIKIWEGNIEHPVTDNRFVGMIEISGNDFDSGVISTGDDIICEYEMNDSGNIVISCEVPSVGISFSKSNFYCRTEGQKDTLDTDRISDEGEELVNRINQIGSKVDDVRLNEAKRKAQNAADINTGFHSAEDINKASNELLEAKKMVYEVRKENLASIRQQELDACVEFFDSSIRRYAKQSEIIAYENNAQAAQKEIDTNGPGFESLLKSLKGKNFDILWGQDWFVIEYFRFLVKNPYDYKDITKYQAYKDQGERSIRDGDIKNLRAIIGGLYSIRIREVNMADMMSKTNIVRG